MRKRTMPHMLMPFTGNLMTTGMGILPHNIEARLKQKLERNDLFLIRKKVI